MEIYGDVRLYTVYFFHLLFFFILDVKYLHTGLKNVSCLNYNIHLFHDITRESNFIMLLLLVAFNGNNS